jgi:hypothetical protein
MEFSRTRRRHKYLPIRVSMTCCVVVTVKMRRVLIRVVTKQTVQAYTVEGSNTGVHVTSV